MSRVLVAVPSVPYDSVLLVQVCSQHSVHEYLVGAACADCTRRTTHTNFTVPKFQNLSDARVVCTCDNLSTSLVLGRANAQRQLPGAPRVCNTAVRALQCGSFRARDVLDGNVWARAVSDQRTARCLHSFFHYSLAAGSVWSVRGRAPTYCP